MVIKGINGLRKREEKGKYQLAGACYPYKPLKLLSSEAEGRMHCLPADQHLPENWRQADSRENFVKVKKFFRHRPIGSETLGNRPQEAEESP